MSRVRSVFVFVLLSLTLGGCASKSAGPAAPDTVVDGPANTESEKRAFSQKGLEAPETASRARPNADRLDLAKLSEAFGPATEVDEAQLARLQNRRNVSDVVTADRSVRATASAESETSVADGDDLGRGGSPANLAEPTSPPAPPPPPPIPPAADPAKSAKPMEEMPGQKTRSLDDGLYKDLRSDEKKKGKLEADEKSSEDKFDANEDLPKTLLPAVERRPSLGKVLVRGPDGKMTALIARAVRVVAHVQGSRARTVVDYVFENPHDQRLEGTFYHPLPADASPAGFSMFDGTQRVDRASFFKSNKLLPDLSGGAVKPEEADRIAPTSGRGNGVRWGKKQTAIVVEQKRAREVYEEIVRSQVDPALLEWAGGSNFEARVFPIEPKSLKRVVVAYEQPLIFDGENHRYGYRLPTETSIVERSATFFVDGRHGKVVAAPEGAKRSQSGRWSRFDMARGKAGAVLEVAVKGEGGNVVLRGRDDSGLPGDAFYAEVRPELPRAADRATGRAILLVDTSLSSEEGDAHARRAAMIRELLEQDRSIEQYAVMLFDVRPRWLHHIGWRSNTDFNRQATYEGLRHVYLEGATSFASVLSELDAQREWAIDGAPTTVFLLSDGDITWGLDRPEALPSRYPIVSDARWITYRFGEASANGELFDMLSRSSGGQTISVLSAADAPAAALAHRQIPVALSSVTVEGAPSIDVTVAGDPRLVYGGQTLKIAGRLPKGGDGTLVVTLASGNSTKRINVALPKGQDDEMAPRAWAELHARRLMALDDPRVDRMVVALSQHYRLANKRASFLILENEAQVEAYALKDEQVDLTDLERLRASEMDQRTAELLGIGLDAVTPEHRKLLTLLRSATDGMAPVLRPQPLLELPYVGGPQRLAAEIRYRADRLNEKQDILLYEGIARARALAGDTAGAVRALSSTVELRPRDAEAMRLVGYALLAVAQYDVATELFERVRLLRPFEPQSFLEEALALDATGRYAEAARNYEIVLGRDWRRHDDESRTTAALHYARLLTNIAKAGSSGVRRAAEARVDELMKSTDALARDLEMDFQLTIHWSTDNVDIDLWVFEPSGEKCAYDNPTTASGGHLLWDVTDGLGPEVYQAARTGAGAYDTLVHFYGSRAPKMQAPTALLMVVDQTPWRSGKDASRKFLMRMLPKRDAVLMMRTDYFSGS